MPTQLIVNPMSGQGKMKSRWPEIEATLRAEGFPFQVAFTERRGHATDVTRAALAAGSDLVVAIGGDGTLFEVVNGMIDQAGNPVRPEAKLAVISSGTGADFVRTIGVPPDLISALRRLAHATKTCPLDIGEIVNSIDGKEVRRYFANVAGMGFDAEVVARLERGGKHGGGTIPYLTTLVTTISSYRNKDVILQLDDRRITGRMNSVIVCNGKYFGGGMKVGPNASIEDGWFDVIIIGDMNTFEVLANTPRIYNGTHLSHPKVSEYRAKTVRVEPSQPMSIQADGEYMGLGPATFRVRPSLLTLLVP